MCFAEQVKVCNDDEKKFVQWGKIYSLKIERLQDLLRQLAATREKGGWRQLSKDCLV
jgi:CRISPR/Cas system-associated endonuclease Cas1